jgi:hypothetical protein
MDTRWFGSINLMFKSFLVFVVMLLVLFFWMLRLVRAQPCLLFVHVCLSARCQMEEVRL